MGLLSEDGPASAPSNESTTAPAFMKFACVRWSQEASDGSREDTTPESVTVGGQRVACSPGDPSVRTIAMSWGCTAMARIATWEMQDQRSWMDCITASVAMPWLKDGELQR